MHKESYRRCRAVRRCVAKGTVVFQFSIKVPVWSSQIDYFLVFVVHYIRRNISSNVCCSFIMHRTLIKRKSMKRISKKRLKSCKWVLFALVKLLWYCQGNFSVYCSVITSRIISLLAFFALAKSRPDQNMVDVKWHQRQESTYGKPEAYWNREFYFKGEEEKE